MRRRASATNVRLLRGRRFVEIQRGGQALHGMRRGAACARLIKLRCLAGFVLTVAVITIVIRAAIGRIEFVDDNAKNIGVDVAHLLR